MYRLDCPVYNGWLAGCRLCCGAGVRLFGDEDDEDGGQAPVPTLYHFLDVILLCWVEFEVLAAMMLLLELELKEGAVR